MTTRKPLLCLDFDGVLHRYDSGWQGADCCPDPMTDGAEDFLRKAVKLFRVAVHSSRSCQTLGIEAMQLWLKSQLYKRMDREEADDIFSHIEWPKEKPPATISIDDRAKTFTGNWADFEPSELLSFQPWNKKTEPQP